MKGLAVAFCVEIDALRQTESPFQPVPNVQPLRSVHHGDQSVPGVPIVQSLCSVPSLAAVQMFKVQVFKGDALRRVGPAQGVDSGIKDCINSAI